MKTLTIILVSFVGIVTLMPFVYYAIHKANEYTQLKEWRKAIIKGMTVIIDDGKNIYRAKVMSVMPGWIRIMTERGTTAGAPLRNVYPLNYVVDEEDRDIESRSLKA